MPADFRPVSEEQMASKGGEIVLRPNEVAIELGGGASHIADGLASVGLRYAYVLGSWAIALAPRAAYGFQHTPASNVDVESIGLQATIEWRSPLNGPVLALGTGAATDFVWQRVERSDAARVAAAGYPTTSVFTAGAFGPIGVVRIRVPLDTTAWIEASVRAEILLARFEDTLGFDWATIGSLGTGASF
jgi:hypothetical protein